MLMRRTIGNIADLDQQKGQRPDKMTKNGLNASDGNSVGKSE